MNIFHSPMLAPEPDHPLASALILRTLRLNALTRSYTPLWEELYDPQWSGYEDWTNGSWPNLPPLSMNLSSYWNYGTPLRSEYARYAALTELDALVAVWLGITSEELVAIYKSRYPVVSGYDSETYFDARGRKIARKRDAFGPDQTPEAYKDLLSHLEQPDLIAPPAGYTAPFYKADREAEMRAAHTHFKARLDKEIAAGRWAPTGEP